MASADGNLTAIGCGWRTMNHRDASSHPFPANGVCEFVASLALARPRNKIQGSVFNSRLFSKSKWKSRPLLLCKSLTESNLDVDVGIGSFHARFRGQSGTFPRQHQHNSTTAPPSCVIAPLCENRLKLLGSRQHEATDELLDLTGIISTRVPYDF